MALSTTARNRCPWPRNDLDTLYHDTEWGVPLHDDHRLFEHFTLSGAQAGLNWSTILKKRDGYRKAFAHFDPEKVARYTQRKTDSLLLDPGIIRNRLKIASAVTNARAILKIQDEFGAFDAYLWRFVDGKPIQNAWKALREIPACTSVSDALSKDLIRRGFKFAGSTICYAVMQSAGLVNDHLATCFRHRQIARLGR